MHEASIAQAILDTALGALPQPPQSQPQTRIIKIVFAAGVLAGVEKDCLELYLSHLAKGTAAEGAQLELLTHPARLVCRNCGHETPYDGTGKPELACGRCGGPNRLEGGQEMFLQSIEVES